MVWKVLLLPPIVAGEQVGVLLSAAGHGVPLG